MARVRDGDVGPLAVLFERHHRALFQFFVRLTANRELSEDLVQDVFFRMLKYRHTYQAGSQFVSWMYQIARNAHIDQGRKRRLEAPMTEDQNERVREIPSGDVGPEERVKQDQQVSLLKRALAQLPEEKREILVLSRYQHLKYEDIGQILKCDPRTVKVRVYRAVRELGRVFFELSGERAS